MFVRDLTVITAALEIVEQRLCEPMNVADLANACFVSYSGLQKLFRYAFGCPVSEYITKRRLSKASRELLSSDISITEIALEHQYESPEAFSRAFRRFWGISPSEFRRTRHFSELQPKFKINANYGGIVMFARKPLDVSELYDELKKMGGTYTLGVDIVEFASLNEKYGYAAGDAVIAETFARIERELPNDMMLFRTGGDEFAVVTGYRDLTDAEGLMRKIIGKNGGAVKVGENDIPFSLHVGIGMIPENKLDYQSMLNILENTINAAKRN